LVPVWAKIYNSEKAMKRKTPLFEKQGVVVGLVVRWLGTRNGKDTKSGGGFGPNNLEKKKEKPKSPTRKRSDAPRSCC